MTQIVAKICVIGEFGVGKTSTVQRFVNNEFSSKYLTTVGVKIDTKLVTLAEENAVKLIIWDIAGTDSVTEVEMAYLRGCAGFLAVADGTRAETLSVVEQLIDRVLDGQSDLPYALLINKSDLKYEWEITQDDINTVSERHGNFHLTSAKSGDQVDGALKSLAAAIFEKELTGR